MDTHEERAELLMEKISSLPKKQRDAIGWLIKHYDFAVKVCKVKPLTDEERTRLMQKAMEHDDETMLVWLLLEKRINADKPSASV